jgi:hypothetical protein
MEILEGKVVNYYKNDKKEINTTSSISSEESSQEASVSP